ncbi:serine hydroxymethyltransferase [Leptolyngbya ohadii]|uniref:serine hydroxymethyltransferase n=1 Tax=Leptolyngbya ohadii TaxID=1962290 RepID=UPI000B59D8D5|nr:serine hydroxymethyltransferase [Leptolyngbya ohadii]
MASIAPTTTFNFLAKTDPTIASILTKELQRQRDYLELTACTNFTSLAVMAAQGFVLTNKAASGLPGNRCYTGCELIDESEQIAIDRAKQLFGAAHANVQPHSGAQANFAVFLALLQPGDTFMGMNPFYSGHSSHGSPTNVSGLWFNKQHYEVDQETECLDYDQIRDLALKHRPKLIICGSSAYSRVIEFDKFRAIADEVDAYLMADIAHIAGLVASGHHPNPVPCCDVVTTTTYKTLRGPKGGLILTRDPELGEKLDKAVFPGFQSAPLQHVIAAKAVAFGEALQPEFKAYCRQVIENARALATQLQKRGFRILSGGTDNHLMVVDLRSIGMTGQQADQLLSSINITANKNSIPFDTQPPFITSGLRLGSPAMTTLGMGTAEFTEIANIIADRLLNPSSEAISQNCQLRIAELCSCFPLYPDLDFGDG